MYLLHLLLSRTTVVTLGAGPKCPALPPYHQPRLLRLTGDVITMAASSPPDVTIPATPRVISPTPTPSESDRAGEDEYFGPVTRSVTRQRVQSRPSPGVSTDRRRTRHDRALSSDGSAVAERRLGLVDGVSGKALRDGNDTAGRDKDDTRIARKDQDLLGVPNGQAGNGHLAPSSSNTWRDISRSPSPLGLIPIHRHWRSVVRWIPNRHHVGRLSD